MRVTEGQGGDDRPREDLTFHCEAISCSTPSGGALLTCPRNILRSSGPWMWKEVLQGGSDSGFREGPLSLEEVFQEF